MRRSPGSSRAARGAGLAGLAAAALALLGGCGTSGVAVARPTPTGSDVANCRALIAAVPADLAPGGTRRAVHPASPYTAASGKPAVTVRCGGDVPAHPASAFVQGVNGVDWLLLTPKGGAQRYVSYLTRPVVEVVIPAAYLPADVLPALSALLPQSTVR